MSSYTTKLKQNIVSYMLGGISEFKIKNEINKVSHVYRIKIADNHKIWFVSILRDGKWVYAGNIRYDSGRIVFKRGNGQYLENSSEVRGLLWVLNRGDNIGKDVSIFYTCKCSVCGRTLTEEKSILRGMGPVCEEKLGLILSN